MSEFEVGEVVNVGPGVHTIYGKARITDVSSIGNKGRHRYSLVVLSVTGAFEESLWKRGAEFGGVSDQFIFAESALEKIARAAE